MRTSARHDRGRGGGEGSVGGAHATTGVAVAVRGVSGERRRCRMLAGAVASRAQQHLGERRGARAW